MIRDDDILAWSEGLNDDDPLKEALKELLALRKALSVTAVYEAEINGVMSSVTKSHYEDCKKFGVKTRELIVKPTPHE